MFPLSLFITFYCITLHCSPLCARATWSICTYDCLLHVELKQGERHTHTPLSLCRHEAWVVFVGVSSLRHSIVDCALCTRGACYFSRLVCVALSTVAGRARGSSRRHLAQVHRNREQLAMIGSAATAAAQAHVRESALPSSRRSCWSRSCWSWSCFCCCSLSWIRLAGIKFQCVDASLSSGWGDILCSALFCSALEPEHSIMIPDPQQRPRRERGSQNFNETVRAVDLSFATRPKGDARCCSCCRRHRSCSCCLLLLYAILFPSR